MAPTGSDLLVQQLHRGQSPGERSAVRQRWTVGGAVQDREGHALRGAAALRDLTEGHHCGRDEAWGQVGRVGSQEERGGGSGVGR